MPIIANLLYLLDIPDINEIEPFLTQRMLAIKRKHSWFAFPSTGGAFNLIFKYSP